MGHFELIFGALVTMWLLDYSNVRGEFEGSPLIYLTYISAQMFDFL